MAAAEDREPPAGVVVPAELTRMVEALIRYGLDGFERRNGVAPDIPGLNALLVQLRAAAVTASGTRRRIVVSPAGTAGHNLTSSEAAQVMGISPRRVRGLAKRGDLIARKRGRDWQIDADSATGYGDRRRTWQAA